MRVVVLSRVAYPLHGYGGLERHAGALVRHLVRAGAQVTLCTSPPNDRAAPASSLDGAAVETVPYRLLPWPRRKGFVIPDRVTNYLAWSLRAARRVLPLRTDVVHAEAGAGFGYAFLAGADAAPLVLQAQGMEEFKANWLKRSAYLPLRRAVRYAARRARRVIVPDRVMEEEVRRFLRVEPERMVVLPLAIDLEEIDRAISAEVAEQAEAAAGIERGAIVLLSVGRLEANKGFDVLIEALARIRDALPPSWLWVVVGRGPEEEALRRKAREAGIAERTRFAGGVSDTALAALYRRAELFVHPTLYEGSSLVTLEAMAHETPVVATAVGGIPDKVEEGVHGFLVPPGAADALGIAIVKALGSPGRLPEMGRKARSRVEAEFAWPRRARRLVEIYRQAQGSSGGDRSE